MQMSWMRQVTGLLVCGGLAAVMVVGCSDDEVAPEPTPAKQQCGGTVESMAGKACTEDGLLCSVPIECYGDNDFQPATCTCVDGVFQCNNTDGKPLEEGQSPSCINEISPDGACPSDPSTAHQSACTAVHQTCRYARPACLGESIGYYDACVCVMVTVGSETAPAWSCKVKECATDSPVASSSSGGSSSGGSSSGGSSSGGSSSGGGN